MITYDKLWETMEKRHMTQYRLIRYYGISAGQIGRLKKNMYVSTHTLEVFCQILLRTLWNIFQISRKANSIRTY